MGHTRATAPQFRRRHVIGIVSGVVVLGLVAGIALVVGPDPLAPVREQADTAATALEAHDLTGLESTLAANRGDPDFAWFFASQVTPRELGDALGSAAGTSKGAPLRDGLDAATYDLALTDLAGVLALATRGTGNRALDGAWTTNLLDAMKPMSASGEDGDRGRQDVANEQNLLLLLSRGYWSDDFLKSATTKFWDWDHASGNAAWTSVALTDAKYAPAPNGAYLTDGILALAAALTANPDASNWAFTDFKPGTKNINFDGEDHALGNFTYYLFFEHQFPGGTATEDESVGMSAAVTALQAAIPATDTVNAVSASEIDVATVPTPGPAADAATLQALAKSLTEPHDGSFWSNAWQALKRVATAVWQWIKRWGHTVLTVLSLVPIAPIAIAAGSVNAAWYAVDGDYASAGLALVAVIPALALAKIASLAKGGAAVDDVAMAATDARAVAVPAAAEDIAKSKSLIQVVKDAGFYPDEKAAETKLAKQFKDAQTQMRVDWPPNCQSLCSIRIWDIFDRKTGTAIEVKYGLRNNPYTVGEIERDVALLEDGSSGVKALRYDFYPDLDGRIGPSTDVLEKLNEYEIPYVQHLPSNWAKAVRWAQDFVH